MSQLKDVVPKTPGAMDSIEVSNHMYFNLLVTSQPHSATLVIALHSCL